MEQRKALHLHAHTSMLPIEIFMVRHVFLMIEHIARMDPRTPQRLLQLRCRFQDPLIQLLAWLHDVALDPCLCQRIGRLAPGAVGQHQIEQMQILYIGPCASDADDVLHTIEFKQLIGIDADARHSHAAAHHGDALSLVCSGVAEHVAHAVELDDILQIRLCDVLCPQRIAGHQYRLGDVFFACLIVCCTHMISSLTFSR